MELPVVVLVILVIVIVIHDVKVDSGYVGEEFQK